MKLKEIIRMLKDMNEEDAIDAIMSQPHLTEEEKSFILIVYLKSVGLKIK